MTNSYHQLRSEILALWIIAKIDLNCADRYRNTFAELLWFFE
jgi:hypothetical protein